MRCGGFGEDLFQPVTVCLEAVRHVQGFAWSAGLARWKQTTLNLLDLASANASFGLPLVLAPLPRPDNERPAEREFWKPPAVAPGVVRVTKPGAKFGCC
jgi:hypothetical protein